MQSEKIQKMKQGLGETSFKDVSTIFGTCVLGRAVVPLIAEPDWDEDMPVEEDIVGFCSRNCGVVEAPPMVDSAAAHPSVCVKAQEVGTESHKDADKVVREIVDLLHVEAKVSGDAICVNMAAEYPRQGPYDVVVAEVVPQDDRDYAGYGRASDRCH